MSWEHKAVLVGRLLSALALTMWAFSFVLHFFEGEMIAAGRFSLPLEGIIGTLPQIGPPLLGWLIIARYPHSPYGWLWALFGLAINLLPLTEQYAVAGLSTVPPLSGAAYMGILADLCWMTLVMTLPFLLLLFPDGRLPSLRWRILAWTILASGTLSLLLLPFKPGPGAIIPMESPLSVGGAAGEAILALAIAGVYGVLVGIALSALTPLLRYRRAGGVEQQQLKWFAAAALLLLVSALFSGILGQELPGLWNALFEALALAGLYAAIGVAVLRYRLWGIDFLINRALVYGALSACVVLIYILVVGYLATVFRASDNLLVSLVATGIVAVLFQPLRERIQRSVNRLLYGERDDPYAVLTRLGGRLRETLEPERVLVVIVETVAQVLKLPYVAIAVAEGETERVVAAWGAPTASVTKLPLVYGSQRVGDLCIGERAPGESLTPGDLRLLEDIAVQTGVAVHAARLTDDLQRSRERLVTAREEERRRLRRDLHDGLGPTLAALALEAATIGDLVATDPAAAKALSDDLYQQIRGTVGEVRRLVYELRPPTLDELGLAGAVREQAARFSLQTRSDEPGRLCISVDAPDTFPPLPAAVEVAAFHIVREALTNVAHHAAAHHCVVRLSLDMERLQIEVLDDGVGLPPQPAVGVGLLSMRERATQLGGTCEIKTRCGGGTCISATLPLTKE